MNKTCPPWCTTPHGAGLLTAHARLCVEIATRHGDVSVELEQSGTWPPMVALSIGPLETAPVVAGFVHLSADEARRLRNSLAVAIELLAGR